MAYKALASDLDATLMHTKPECFRDMLRETLVLFNIPKKELTDEKMDRLWYDHNRNEILTEDYGILPENFWGVYKWIDTESLRRDNAGLYDDIGFLGELKERGIRLVIVSGAPAHMMRIGKELIESKTGYVLDSVVRSQESSGVRQKPDPHGLVKCMREMGVKKNEIIYVGNGWEDIEMAKSAGVFSALIDRDEYKIEIRTEPDIRISSLYELDEFFK